MNLPLLFSIFVYRTVSNRSMPLTGKCGIATIRYITAQIGLCFCGQKLRDATFYLFSPCQNRF
ncbi:hypothetical protein THS27_24040 [Thalassospira sp. MCCC 1A01428]|nr:hypothetical protein THS27_24040 [Thalassospira sp. MCCC 1A01428]